MGLQIKLIGSFSSRQTILVNYCTSYHIFKLSLLSVYISLMYKVQKLSMLLVRKPLNILTARSSSHTSLYVKFNISIFDNIVLPLERSVLIKDRVFSRNFHNNYRNKCFLAAYPVGQFLSLLPTLITHVLFSNRFVVVLL
jgi:hypothetical protein